MAAALLHIPEAASDRAPASSHTHIYLVVVFFFNNSHANWSSLGFELHFHGDQ